jgi:hypothetical protein
MRFAPRPARGPAAMRNACDTAVANGTAGISWWALGGDSSCHGPVPASDPGCRREQELAQLDADARSAHS